MMNRFNGLRSSTRSKSLLSTIRQYSDTSNSGPTSESNSNSNSNDAKPFLSSLLARIDQLNSTSKNTKKNSSSPPKSNKINETNVQSRLKNINLNSKSSKPSKPSKPLNLNANNSQSTSINSTRIRVKNHPLATNTFKEMDSSNFNSRNNNSENRTNNNRRSFPRKSNRPPIRRTFKPSIKSITQDQTIVSKKIESKPLQPILNANTFFYGKPVSLITGNINNKLSAVSKQLLIDSKYPYKLPKEIINSINSEFNGNRYILQKNWNLNVVNNKSLTAKINSIVKGKVNTSVSLDLNKGKLTNEPLANDINNKLMKNGNLSMNQRKKIFNLTNGLVDYKKLFINAAWNKVATPSK